MADQKHVPGQKECPYCDNPISAYAGVCHWCQAAQSGRSSSHIRVRPVPLVCSGCVRRVYLDSAEYGAWQEQHLPEAAMTCPFCGDELTTPAPASEGMAFDLVGVGKTDTR